MSELFEDANEGALAAVVSALDDGGLVVFPTDTVYGVAARPEFAEATASLFEAKARPRDLTLPVLVSDPSELDAIGVTAERAGLLAERFWPGALTIVLARTERSRLWDLGKETETIAVRMPDHPVALEVLRRTGPLATTSANRSGEPDPRDCDGVRAALGDAVSVYLCAGPLPNGTASTVVSLVSGEPEVLREGPIRADEVLRTIR